MRDHYWHFWWFFVFSFEIKGFRSVVWTLTKGNNSFIFCCELLNSFIYLQVRFTWYMGGNQWWGFVSRHCLVLKDCKPNRYDHLTSRISWPIWLCSHSQISEMTLVSTMLSNIICNLSTLYITLQFNGTLFPAPLQTLGGSQNVFFTCYLAAVSVFKGYFLWSQCRLLSAWKMFIWGKSNV